MFKEKNRIFFNEGFNPGEIQSQEIQTREAEMQKKQEERWAVMSSAELDLQSSAPIIDYNEDDFSSIERKSGKKKDVLSKNVSTTLTGLSAFSVPAASELDQLNTEISGYKLSLEPSDNADIETPDYLNVDVSTINFGTVDGFRTGLNVFYERTDDFMKFVENKQNLLNIALNRFNSDLAEFEEDKGGVTSIYRAIGEDEDTNKMRDKRNELVEKIKAVKESIEKKKEESAFDSLSNVLLNNTNAILIAHRNQTGEKLKELELKEVEYEKKKYENDKQQVELKEYKLRLTDYQEQSKNGSKKISSSVRALEEKKTELTRDVSGDIYSVQKNLDEVNRKLEEVDLEEDDKNNFLLIKEDLEAKLTGLTDYQSKSADLVEKISGSVSKLKKDKKSLNDTNKQIDDALTIQIPEKEKALQDFGLGLDSAIIALGAYKENFETGIPDADSAIKDMVYNAREIIPKTSQQISHTVSSFEDQVFHYESMDIDQPGVVRSVFDSAVDVMTNTTTWALKGVSNVLDYVNSGIDELPWYFRYPSEVLFVAPSVLNGACKGVTGITEGIGSIVKHPLDTANGLGSLLGRNPEDGEWSLEMAGDSWWNMGKAVLYADDFSYTDISDYFEWTGKIGVGVLMTVGSMGAGGVAKGVRSVVTAGKVGLKIGAKQMAKDVIIETAKQSKFAYKAVKIGVKNLPARVTQGVADIVGAPGRAMRVLAKENRVFQLAKNNRKMMKLADELVEAQKLGKPTVAIEKALEEVSKKVLSGRETMAKVLDREALSLSKNILKKEKQLRKAREAGDVSKASKLEKELEGLTAKKVKLDEEILVLMDEELGFSRAAEEVGTTAVGAKAAEEAADAEVLKNEQFWKEGKDEDLFVNEVTTNLGDTYVIYGKEFEVASFRKVHGDEKGLVTLRLKSDPSFSIKISKISDNTFVIHQDQWANIKIHFESGKGVGVKTETASKPVTVKRSYEPTGKVVTREHVVLKPDTLDSVVVNSDEKIAYLERAKNNANVASEIEVVSNEMIASMDSATIAKAEIIANETATIKALPKLNTKIAELVDENVVRSITRKIEETVPTVKNNAKLKQYLLAAVVMLSVGYLISNE